MFYTITTMRTTLGKYFVFAALVMATMVGCMKDDFEDINLVGDVTFTAKVNLDTLPPASKSRWCISTPATIR